MVSNQFVLAAVMKQIKNEIRWVLLYLFKFTKRQVHIYLSELEFE